MGANTLTKQCGMCKEHICVTKYYTIRARKDGLDDFCKDCRNKRNREDRMFVNGQHVSKKHPLWKAGCYTMLDDTFFFKAKKVEEASTEGYVYIISNPAWPNMVKVGMAQNPSERLSTFQTYSPMRDYTIEHTFHSKNYVKAEAKAHKVLGKRFERAQGEWFLCTPQEALKTLEAIL